MGEQVNSAADEAPGGADEANSGGAVTTAASWRRKVQPVEPLRSLPELFPR